MTATVCMINKVKLKITKGINNVIREKRAYKLHKLNKALCLPREDPLDRHAYADQD